MFPTKAGREFANSFPTTARHLYTQFLRIFAHLYHAHFVQVLHLSLEAHLNVCSRSSFCIFVFTTDGCISSARQSLFAHFLVFGLTFDLLDPKECRAPRDGASSS
jgi:MOB kinase activator 1